MDSAKLKSFVRAEIWDDAVVPTLTEYIRIPNKSPAFDPDWAAHGYMRDAVKLFERWARDKIAAIEGAALEVVQLAGRTPLIFIEIPGEGRRPFCSTAISTSSRRWWAGRKAWAVDARARRRQIVRPRRRR
jgi:hypothetical protein